jgi:preprotein translocase subunit SecG
MLFGLTIAAFTVMCFLLIFIIFLQKGKGSMGLGAMGGQTQTLFGGSGGQDLFQKATWVLVGLYLFGSLGLSIYKTKLMTQSVKVAINTKK